MTKSYQLWEMGWLQWGFELKMLTKEAEERLSNLKETNKDKNFEELAEKVRNGEILAR